MDVCLRVLKESNKSRFDSYSRQEHNTFRDCRVRIFPDKLSRNSCISSPSPSRHDYDAKRFMEDVNKWRQSCISLSHSTPGEFAYIWQSIREPTEWRFRCRHCPRSIVSPRLSHGVVRYPVSHTTAKWCKENKCNIPLEYPALDLHFPPPCRTQILFLIWYYPRLKQKKEEFYDVRHLQRVWLYQQGHLIHAPLIVQNIDGFRKKDLWTQFFKRWIALSEGKTTIRRTSGRETSYAIQRIVACLADRIVTLGLLSWRRKPRSIFG